MPRSTLLLSLAALALLSARAWPDGPADEGPPISITSPDTGTTYALATIKNRSLSWNKRNHALVVHVTFSEIDSSSNSPAEDDTHEFRLPGIVCDEAKGIFYATTAQGEQIPVAHYKKVLFMKDVVTTPNAVVRIIHPRGENIRVILEAISPNDPAMHAQDPGVDATHDVKLQDLFK